MKKIELVYLEILSNFEKGNKKMTQAGIAGKLNISLSTVNHALLPLRKMGAVEIHKNGFSIVNAKKILYLLASIRNLEKEIIYRTRVEMRAKDIEKNMPPGVIYGAYSAYVLKFGDPPSDYSEIYIYADSLEEIKKRFPEKKEPYNLFILKKSFDEMPLALLFADLWNLKEWYAKEFLDALEKKIREAYS